LLSCNSTVESSIPDDAKKVDIFAKAFIEKIINGQIDSEIANLNPSVATSDAFL